MADVLLKPEEVFAIYGVEFTTDIWPSSSARTVLLDQTAVLVQLTVVPQLAFVLSIMPVLGHSALSQQFLFFNDKMSEPKGRLPTLMCRPDGWHWEGPEW